MKWNPGPLPGPKRQIKPRRRRRTKMVHHVKSDLKKARQALVISSKLKPGLSTADHRTDEGSWPTLGMCDILSQPYGVQPKHVYGVVCTSGHKGNLVEQNEQILRSNCIDHIGCGEAEDRTKFGLFRLPNRCVH